MSDSPAGTGSQHNQRDVIGIVIEGSSSTIPPLEETTADTSTHNDATADITTASPAAAPQPSGASPGSASLAAPMDKMSISLLEDSLTIQMETRFGDEEDTPVPLPEDEVFATTPNAPADAQAAAVDERDVVFTQAVRPAEAPPKVPMSPVMLTFSDPTNIVAQMEARQDRKLKLMHQRRTEEIHLKEQQLERALNEIKVREVALLASERAHGSLLQYDETVSGREQRVIEAEAKLHQRTAEVLKREQEVIRLLKEHEKKYNSLTAPLAAREQEITRRTEDLAAKESDLEHRSHLHMRKMTHDEEALTSKERAARDLESRAREQLQGLDKKQQELDLLNGHLQKKQKLLRSEEQEIDGRERELALREQQATQNEVKLAGSTEKLEARESALMLSIAELHASTAALDVRTSQLNAREQRLSAEAGKLVDAEKDIQFHTDALNEKERYSARVMREASIAHDEAQQARSEAARELLEAQRIRQETDSLKAGVKRQQQQLEARMSSLHQREIAIKLAHYELEQRQQRFPLLRSQYLSGMGARSPTGRGGGHSSGGDFPSKRAFSQTPEGKRVATVYSSRVIRAVPLADEMTTAGRASMRKSKLSQSLPPIHLGKGGSAPQSAYDNPLPPMHNTSRPRLSPLNMGGNSIAHPAVSTSSVGGGEAANLTQLALTHKPSRSPPPPAPRGASPTSTTPVKRDHSDPTPSSWGSVDTPSSCRFTSTTLSSSLKKSSPMSSDVEDHRQAVTAQRSRRSDKRLAAKQAHFRKRRAMQLSKVKNASDPPTNATSGSSASPGDALALHRAGVQDYVAASAPTHDDTTFVAAAQQAAEMRSAEQFCDSLALKFQDHLQGIIEGRQHAAIEAPPAADDDISWEVSPQGKNPSSKASHSFRPSSKKAGISVYRELSDDQVRELFSAYSNQDDAKTEYDFLLYRVLAQDPQLKAPDGVPTPAQDAALVHRLASMQVLLEKAFSASHEANSKLTASYATATLLAVQGRLRDLLTYRKELNMDALAVIEEAVCKS